MPAVMLGAAFGEHAWQVQAARRARILQRACPGRLDPELHFRIMREAEAHVLKHGRKRSCLDVCGERGDLFWVIRQHAALFQLED